jgi:alpha-tubulin suppressor-like RCC1 family protein
VILIVAPAVAHPILYVLKRAGLLSRLPEGFPLFVWSFFLMVEAGEAPPQAEPAAPAIRAVVPGNYHAFALTESGELYAWGPMGSVLGLGDDRNYLRPTKVPGLSNIKAIFLDSGLLDHYTFALTESGEVYAWGGNEKGQLGLGDAKDRRRPTKVPGLARVKSIAVGGGLIFALALTESGEVYAWGQNERGQLGLGDREDRLTPTKVPGLTGIKAIAAGHSHSLALTESGEVYAWGRNDKGQLGLGDTGDRLTPTRIPF